MGLLLAEFLCLRLVGSERQEEEVSISYLEVQKSFQGQAWGI